MTYRIYIVFLMGLLLAACANRGTGPQGGPRDTIPPKVVKESPVYGTLQVTNKKVEIIFDEYIQLQDIQKHVLISPPQLTQPEIKAIGKTLSVVFQEDLLDSTTYTIDFGAAICDYNEKTPLEGYVLAFSTGDHMDTLQIAGRVYNAANLNPMPSVIVGIQPAATASLDTVPFLRVTRTDEEGYFTLHNISLDNYQLYALNDISRDYIYQPGEGLAFMDTTITPYAIPDIYLDTLWRDTLGIHPLTGDTLFTQLIDTVHQHHYTRFMPDSVVIWYFEEAKQRHYFQRILREHQHAFTLIFSAPQDSLPVLEPLLYSQIDSTASDSAWVNFMDHILVQSNPGKDTITYWLTDSAAILMDTIPFKMTYAFSDSLYNIIPKTDTLQAVFRHPRLSEKAQQTYERNKRERQLSIKTNASSKFEIYDTIRLYMDYPVDSLSQEMIHLTHKVDTLMQPIAFQLVQSDSIGMTYSLIAQLAPTESYLLLIDSAACRDIYGACNKKVESKIRLKSLDEYSSLVVKMEHFDSRARIQLLNEKDQVVAEKAAQDLGVLFPHLVPKTFYLRLYIDLNGDGEWTTGDWLLRRQPEPIYYYPSKLKLRANWDFEEIFDHLALPQIESKPYALYPKTKKNNR